MWNQEMECMPRGELEKLQLERLKTTVQRVYDKVPAYRKKFDEAGVAPGHIQSLKDLSKLPFTTKDDLRDNYPFGLFAVPMEEVVRIHSSSGTTGKATVVGYTRKDVDTWAETMARTLGLAGATHRDFVQIAYGYGLFTGGLGVHYGTEKLGATAIPMSGGNTRRQLAVMQDFGSNVIACTPSYALCIAEMAEEEGIDIEKTRLRVGIFGAEPWTDNMRKQIEKLLKIDALDIYGLSEVIGPGVSAECLEKDGLHICEDHFIPEIIDPDTGEVLEPGQQGELVFTCVTKEALPLIRYRTRDITSLNYEKCACGRTAVRMARTSGRTDDMLIIRGVNVFPSQIESVLMDIEGAQPHYLIVVERKGSLDDLEVQVEVEEKLFSDEVKVLQSLKQKIADEIKSVCMVGASVKLVEPKTLERSMGKAKRVIDKRNL
jgi:phenylacetate-CoA ligase